MKHYIASDIHGNMAAYKAMIEYMEGQGDYTLYFLGDAIDRGADGFQIMKELLSRGDIFYFKGNHEDLFVHAAFEMADIALEMNCSKKELVKQFGSVSALMNYGMDMPLYKANGGEPTFKDWIKEGCQMHWIYQLNRLPVFGQYKNIDMCHAGCSRHDWEINNVEAALWDRTHFSEPWFKDRILVHGHTPVKSAEEQHYCNNQKWNLDSGCWHTNNLSLMDIEANKIIHIQV